MKEVKKWKFKGHSFYFHDDNAVYRLIMEKEWPMFPQLRSTMYCLRNAGGAAMADLWRYLVLWEYGGIYTDIDNRPRLHHLNESTIPDDMESFFLREHEGFLSQFFFAISPKHPLMFLAVQRVLNII